MPRTYHIPYHHTPYHVFSNCVWCSCSARADRQALSGFALLLPSVYPVSHTHFRRVTCSEQRVWVFLPVCPDVYLETYLGPFSCQSFCPSGCVPIPCDMACSIGDPNSALGIRGQETFYYSSSVAIITNTMFERRSRLTRSGMRYETCMPHGEHRRKMAVKGLK